MKHLNNTFIIISILMAVGGLTLDVLVWLHMVAKSEPQLVLHLSTAALYIAGFGNVISALVNKEVKS